MDLWAKWSPICRSHVRREWSYMPIGLKDLTGQFFLFKGFELPLLFGLVGEKGLLMPGAKWKWSWSWRNDLDGMHTCARRSRCLVWKSDMWKGAPYRCVKVNACNMMLAIQGTFIMRNGALAIFLVVWSQKFFFPWLELLLKEDGYS